MSWFVKLGQATVICLAGAAMISGCGGRNLPDMGSVSGVVTLDGQPLPKATVRFFPTAGRPSQAVTRDDGSYELSYVGGEKGALLGEHRVTISTFMQDEDLTTHKMVTRAEKLPARYNAKSELTRVVEPNHNEFNFDLTSK